MELTAQLSERFIEAFEALEAEGTIQRSSQRKRETDGLSYTDVAWLIYGDCKAAQSSLTQVLRGKRPVTLEAAINFCDNFGVNKAFLFFGEGEMFI